jgi:hypothetical protein
MTRAHATIAEMAKRAVHVVSQCEMHHVPVKKSTPTSTRTNFGTSRVGRAAVACAFVLGSIVAASPAHAADPVAAGTARIGTHPNLPAPMVAFWKQDYTYTLATNHLFTFLNAPDKAGYLQFQVGGRPMLELNWKGALFYIDRFNNQSIAIGEAGTGTFDAVARIGNMPAYGKNYVGVWLDLPNCSNCAARDYALLADSENTFVNAPRRDRGTVYIRSGNVDLMSISVPSGLRVQTTASKPGGGSWSALSDRRVKKDISAFQHGLAALEKIRPVSFRYNGLGGTRETEHAFVGVVAQELEPVLPFMVTSTPKKLHAEDATPTNLKEVDPSALTYVLINAVKELSAENKEMKRMLCAEHPAEAFCKKK